MFLNLLTVPTDEVIADLPSEVDWNKKGLVRQPGHQANCGACWAFSTAAALESLAVISGAFKELPEFSVQQLVDCDLVNMGCRGGWMYDAFAYVM